MIRLATNEDIAFLVRHDEHIAPALFAQKLERREIYVACEGGKLIGWLRYSLFWDMIPFMNMLELLPEYRGKGLGRQLVLFWEEEMRAQGHKRVMTSTQQNEFAQHFYTRLSYNAVGGFALPGDVYELMMAKEIAQ